MSNTVELFREGHLSKEVTLLLPVESICLPKGLFIPCIPGFVNFCMTGLFINYRLTNSPEE